MDRARFCKRRTLSNPTLARWTARLENRAATTTTIIKYTWYAPPQGLESETVAVFVLGAGTDGYMNEEDAP